MEKWTTPPWYFGEISLQLSYKFETILKLNFNFKILVLISNYLIHVHSKYTNKKAHISKKNLVIFVKFSSILTLLFSLAIHKSLLLHIWNDLFSVFPYLFEWIKIQVLYPCHFYLNKPYSVEHKTVLFLLIILVKLAEYWNCFIPKDLGLTEVQSLVLAIWYFVEAAMEENKQNKK